MADHFLFLRTLSILASITLMAWGCSHTAKDLPSAYLLAERGHVVDTTPTVAKKIIADSPHKSILVEFVTDWCQVCEDIRKPVGRLAEEGSGRYLVVRLDVTHDEGALSDFGMKSAFPGFKLIAPGLKEPIKKYGSNSFADISSFLQVPAGSDLTVPLAFNRTALALPPKAVLVAGSSQNANFAQEVVWLYGVLQDKGLKPEDIACFYAKPDSVQYFADKKQFDLLAADLKICRPSDRGDILRAIQKGLIANPSQFFFYATSHGAPPAPTQLSAEQLRCYPHAPALIIDNGENECDGLNHLTPDAVASIIPEDSLTKKVFVFQSCYSGGFIANGDDVKQRPSALAKLPAITLFTAARSDRPSFGCSSGDIATYYGASFTKGLMDDKNPMDNVDWNQVNKVAQQLTRKLEKKMGIGKSSHPQFFINP